MRPIVLICVAASAVAGAMFVVISRPGSSENTAKPAPASAREAGIEPRELLDRARQSAARGDREATFETLDLCLDRLAVDGSGAGSDAAGETLRFALDVAHRFRDYHRLEQYASRLLDRTPGDTEGLMAMGLAQRQLGGYRSAEDSLRRWLALSPEGSARREQVQLELGLALLKQKRPRDALEELVKLLLENPYSRPAYVQLGQCLSRLARPDTAESFFELAQTLSRGDAESRRAADFLAADRPVLAARFRARSFVLRGQFAAAERILREASSTGSPGARVYLVEYLMNTQQVQAARRALEGLASLIGRSHPDVKGWTAMALEREGRASEAVEILAELCREHRQLVGVWAPELARILLEDLATPHQALRWLEVYLATHESIEARILLARALVEVDEPEEAIDILEATPSGGYSWEEGAGDVWLAFCRARVGQDLRKVDEVLTSIAASRKHLPEYHLAMVEWQRRTELDAEGLSSSRREARRLTTSMEEFRILCQRAARADGPEVASHLSSAAEVLHAIGDRERAIRFARIASSAAPDDPRAWTLLERWQRRPEEAFFRAEASRRLAGEAETSSSVLSELLARLAGRDR